MWIIKTAKNWKYLCIVCWLPFPNRIVNRSMYKIHKCMAIQWNCLSQMKYVIMQVLFTVNIPLYLGYLTLWDVIFTCIYYYLQMFLLYSNVKTLKKPSQNPIREFTISQMKLLIIVMWPNWCFTILYDTVSIIYMQ